MLKCRFEFLIFGVFAGNEPATSGQAVPLTNQANFTSSRITCRIQHMSTEKNPAKKWGDTKIAERGRSVLVMRARCRSAGLTLHQREWTDAAGRYHGCNCVIDQCKCSCFYTTLRERARCILHHCTPPASLSYARDQHGLHGARIMLSVRIEDPLPGRRAGS